MNKFLDKNNKFNLIYIFVCFAILFSILMFGWIKTWKFLSVGYIYPPFNDLRVIPLALNIFKEGLDPYTHVLLEGTSWYFNYPSIWILIGDFFKLNTEYNFLIFAISNVFIYLVVCYFFLKKYPSPWLLVAFFSGSSLLCVERGNVDLIIFYIIYLAIISPILFRSFLIFICSILKIYPIFSFIISYRNKFFISMLLFLFGLYFLYHLDEFLISKNNTPISAINSYGTPTISYLINKIFKIKINYWIINIFLIIFCFISYKSRKLKKLISYKTYNEQISIFFLTGASIFLGTFLFSGNFVYRLIFIIFCIPFVEKILNNKLRYSTLFLILIASNDPILFYNFFSVPIAVLINVFSTSILFIIISLLTIKELIYIAELYKLKRIIKFFN
jgi:hypothetical protein